MKKYISKESIEYQKKVAVKMWQYIKRWYVTHPDEYRHPMLLKSDFHADYFEKTKQKIDWESNCILCEKYFCNDCHGCPLYSGDNEHDTFCDEYFKLSDVDFPYDMRPSVCDRIIEAIESYEE